MKMKLSELPEIHTQGNWNKKLAEKDNALKQLKEYFEENHTERIKYPEYLEFHHYHMILLALGIVEKL